MQKIKLGIIKEGKVPPDHRVALTPKQCKTVQIIYPNVVRYHYVLNSINDISNLYYNNMFYFAHINICKIKL
mgnify:CR=1 FL=1